MDVLQFITNYEKILKERHIPKMVFYKECGISDAAVSQWRTGKSYPSRKSVERIATFLDVPVQSLIDGEETEKPTAAPDPLYSPDEAEFIFLYRLASEDDKAVIDAVLRKYRQPEKKEKRA